MVDTSFPVQRLSRPPTRRQSPSYIGYLDWFLFVLFVTGMAGLLLRGWQFYSLSLGERVDHADYRVLGPSSSLGQAYGIAGTLLILTNLSYLVRRRFARASVGSLRAWLDVHAFTGLFGGMLIVFHSAFQVRSTMAVITIGSLFVVIATGLVGRFLFSLTPTADSARVAELLGVLDRVGPGMGKVIAERAAEVPVSEVNGTSLIAALVALPRFWRERAERIARIDDAVAYYAYHRPEELRLVARAMRECRHYYRTEVRARAASAVLRSWRGLHRFSALLMVALVALHIGVAWYYGFTWAFSD